MNYKKIGTFICSLRKEKNLTQKELADKLNITNKAISKWERGISCPDISLLIPLSDILDVTTNEILNGEREEISDINEDIDRKVKKTLSYMVNISSEKSKKYLNYIFLGISFSLIISIIICLICDYVLYNSFSWSLVVCASCILSWLIILSIFKSKKNRFKSVIISITLSIIPYLFTLSIILENNLIFSLGSIFAILGIVYIWILYYLYIKMKHKKFKITGIAFLLLIPLSFSINRIANYFLGPDPFEIFNVILNTFSAIIIALICFKISKKRNED